ncbi:MAG: membrane or secreted protein [Flavobacteriales bacterium]|nr:membrane or secreted protein [Flavobacteriales bacterium]
MEWTTIGLSIALLALGVAGISIKIWAKKGGEFAGTCASNNPALKDESGGCSVCGANPEDVCQKEYIV